MREPVEGVRNIQRIARVYLNGKEVDHAGLRSTFTSPD
jgi:hypothetical protein